MAINRSKLIEHALVAIPPPPARFTLSEWHLNNRFRNRICLDQQKLADSVIAESDRLIDVVNEKTDLNKRDADHKLHEKIKDIEFNRDEINKQRKEVCMEIDNLNTYMDRLHDALNALKETAMRVCKKCLILREGRLGIDLCCDAIDRELKKEYQILEGSQNLLRRTLEQANEQVRRLRSTIYFMDRDLEDKGNVLKIDSQNCSLKETSLNLSIYYGFAPLDPSNITLEEWEQYTRANIEKAAKEINSARQLRSYVDTLLKQVIEDLCNQYHIVNEAFRKRIEETKEVKLKLEVQHSEVARQANEMTRAITRLDKAITEKEGYMALAHTRLGNRAQRPGMELCKDLVEITLANEVGELRQNVATLQQQRAEAEASLRYLLKTQIQLEEDINIKTNTLKIDEVDCMTLRQSVDYHSF
ncbi:tektin-1 [Anoplophora glabripennis]|uniref:tektin-1 n=1 Tax=Anoplophora glabripennis TaxID=217634 RepID=UPI000A138012|nr:tektin-1 [Anoplophora glabripennis]